MLILASASPQRRAILEQLGVEFVVRPADAEELSEGDPREVALENARRKVQAALTHDSAPAEHPVPGAGCSGGAESPLVLGVDTLVALDAAIYGKPRDEAHAKETLRALAGRTHQVVSGIAIGPQLRTAVAVTDVSFRDLDDGRIDWYVQTGEWRGRAGGYAIQGRGAALVREIRGDYLNVVGLPVPALLDLLPDLLG